MGMMPLKYNKTIMVFTATSSDILVSRVVSRAGTGTKTAICPKRQIWDALNEDAQAGVILPVFCCYLGS
jgi:hypothetical protein